MQFYTLTPKSFFNKEIEAYKQHLKTNNMEQSWNHLERAHVIGQSYPYQHSYVHLEMLKFGFKIKNTKEVIGQIPRLLVGGVTSFVGQIPLGSTAEANIPPLKGLPIE